MNPAPSIALSFSTVCRSLLMAAATMLLAASCNNTPDYGANNVFVPGQSPPRYGYGSSQPAGSPGDGGTSQSVRDAQSGTSTRKTPPSKIKNINRDPSDTSLDLTPPEPKSDDQQTADTPSSNEVEAPATTSPEKSPEPSTATAKPAAPREDLPVGQPVVGKKGFVYSPYASDKGQVDVQDIPSGTKVKCPYTGKTFRVP